MRAAARSDCGSGRIPVEGPPRTGVLFAATKVAGRALP
jgi:hypothetical protein